MSEKRATSTDPAEADAYRHALAASDKIDAFMRACRDGGVKELNETGYEITRELEEYYALRDKFRALAAVAEKFDSDPMPVRGRNIRDVLNGVSDPRVVADASGIEWRAEP